MLCKLAYDTLLRRRSVLLKRSKRQEVCNPRNVCELFHQCTGVKRHIRSSRDTGRHQRNIIAILLPAPVPFPPQRLDCVYRQVPVSLTNSCKRPQRTLYATWLANRSCLKEPNSSPFSQAVLARGVKMMMVLGVC